MPKRLKKNSPYQYIAGDNLPNLAKQNGVTEQEILAANPGGYPFDVGQTINIPQNPSGPPINPSPVPPVPYSPPVPARAPQPQASNSQFAPEQNSWNTIVKSPTVAPQPQSSQFGSTMSSAPTGKRLDIEDYGEYVDANGNIQKGTTPFGVNRNGERLDVNGDVWIPNDAKKDIYGGKFIQKGSVRWERNRNGKLIKVKYLGGGKKVTVAGGRKKGGGHRSAAEQAAINANKAAEQAQDYTLANSLVSFGVGSG